MFPNEEECLKGVTGLLGNLRLTVSSSHQWVSLTLTTAFFTLSLLSHYTFLLALLVLCQLGEKCLLLAVLWEWSGNTFSKKEINSMVFKTVDSDESHLVLIFSVITFAAHEAHRQLVQIRGAKLWVFSKGKYFEMGVCQPQSQGKNHSSFLSESTARWPNGVSRKEREQNDATPVLLCRKHWGAQNDR